METRPVYGTGDEKTTGFFFDFYEQWSSIFKGRSNWYDFTLIKIQGEYSPYSGRVELDLAFFGFAIFMQYVFSSKFNDEMKEVIAGIESGEIKTYPISSIFGSGADPGDENKEG